MDDDSFDGFNLLPLLDDCKVLEAEIEQNVDSTRSSTPDLLDDIFISATDYFAPEFHQKLTFGCPSLDNLTRGGIPIVTFVEIPGMAGAGKTQICMQLASTAQLPERLGGLNRKVVYVDTENCVNTTRMLEIGQGVWRRLGYKSNASPLDGIFLLKFFEEFELVDCIESETDKNSLQRLMKQHPIGLIIIDSIAGVFRLEDEYKERSTRMASVVQGLMALAHAHNAAVVVTNQVSTLEEFEREKYIPCLGIVWANRVEWRLQVYRSETEPTRRWMQVKKAQSLPAQTSAGYRVTAEGVEDEAWDEECELKKLY